MINIEICGTNTIMLRFFSLYCNLQCLGVNCILAYVLLSISSIEGFESYMPKIFDIVVLDYMNL